MPVIEWLLTADDVARIRFAFSPLLETVLSLIVLRDPSHHALHLPWVRSARTRVTGSALSELFALVPVRGIVADFLTPPPTTPLPEFEAELELLRNTPPSRVLADLADVAGIPQPARERIIADPVGAIERIADQLNDYWTLAVAEHWPRLQALLEADVLWRSRRLAVGGAAALFADLDETVRWHQGRVTVSDRFEYSGALTGQGLVLIPSAMAWPALRKFVHPYPATVVYPARAIATLWESGPPPAAEALTQLVGRTRAQLLTLLGEPSSTTALSRRLQVTASAVSQHLTVLQANGLVTRTRVGATVLYHRTAKADTLLLN